MEEGMNHLILWIKLRMKFNCSKSIPVKYLSNSKHTFEFRNKMIGLFCTSKERK